MMRTLWLAVGLSMFAVGDVRADEVPLYACRETPATTKISATFSADTSVKDLVTWVIGFTCKNVVIDADVDAHVPRVTIVSPKQMTPKQALQLFTDALETAGLKVVHKKDTILIRLGPNMPRNCPATTASAGPVDKSTNLSDRDPVESSAADVDKLLAAGIKKIDDTHYEITRATVDAVLANPMAVAKGARVVPAMANGKPIGFKVYAVRPASLYARISLQNGDTIEKINGHALTSADKALDVYTKLREATVITISLARAGKPVTLTITIKS